MRLYNDLDSAYTARYKTLQFGGDLANDCGSSEWFN